MFDEANACINGDRNSYELIITKYQVIKNDKQQFLLNAEENHYQ